MKTEQRKKEDRELIERFCSRFAGNSYFSCDSIIKKSSEFIKSENLEAKPKLELNRWIVNDNSPEWMIYLKGDTEYFGMEGKKFFKRKYRGNNIARLEQYNSRVGFRYATNEEILEGLSKIAVEMGYKERQSECLYSCIDSVDLSNSVFELSTNGSLWITSCSPLELNCIFKDGKWAKFIETDTERIERLEKRVKELENKNK